MTTQYETAAEEDEAEAASEAAFRPSLSERVRPYLAGAAVLLFGCAITLFVFLDVRRQHLQQLDERSAGSLHVDPAGGDRGHLVAPDRLEAQGFEITPGEELTEKARSIKGPDEIKAMRCASLACENAIALMEDSARTGVPGGTRSVRRTSGHSPERSTLRPRTSRGPSP